MGVNLVVASHFGVGVGSPLGKSFVVRYLLTYGNFGMFGCLAQFGACLRYLGI